jgi:malate/lactate dehydrogenase
MRVTIVGGAGGVGASVAFNLLRMDAGHEVAIVDNRPHMIASHVMDLEQTLLLGAGDSIREGDDADLHEADVVILAAAVPLTVNTSRMVYLEDNAAIVGAVLDELDSGWGGVLLLVTNPVDPLGTWALRRSGIDRRRLVGYTINDSLRLRSGIGQALGVDARAVDAWCIGEHGDGAVPLFDRVAVDGKPVELSGPQRAQAEEFLRTWYVKHVALDSGRSSTWTSGAGVARMAAALGGDEGELWPASVALDGEYGVEGVCLSVPVTIGRGGLREIHEWELGPAESEGMQRAARFVREAADSIG